MTGIGRAGGAATIVNAFATGRGAAFGLAAGVTARVAPAPAWSVWNGRRRLGRAQARLALESARAVQGAVGRVRPLRIRVRSRIPPRRGLKSSSAVSVAVARAVLDHEGSRLHPAKLLPLLAEAGLRSRTSLTGAMDDLAACCLGGVVFTDNLRRRVLRVDDLAPGLTALVHAPRATLATGSLRRSDFLPLGPAVEQAWKLAWEGRYREAMLANTLAYAPALGVRPSFTFRALTLGAYAAGLSGKGPAEVALVHRAKRATLRGLRGQAAAVDLNPGGAS